MAGNPGSNPKRNTSWKLSLDAPHTVLDASGYPRVTAASQPAEHQAEFAQFYPNGLPVTYHMLHGHDSGGVPQQYMENHLPVRFYTHPPPHAIGKFSTLYGHYKQFSVLGELLPERRVHLWNKDEIQSVCNSLRQIFWGDMKTLRRPTRWDDLWEYFDAVDLYHYGVLNIWNVMNTLFDENCMIHTSWRAEVSVEIGHFVDEWMKEKENQEKLKGWDEMKGPVLCCLTSSDWKQISNLQDGEIGLLRSALQYRRQTLLSGNVPQANRPAADLFTAYQTNNLTNWLADSQILGRNGLPPPPASAPYHGPQPGMNATAPCFVRSGARSGSRNLSDGGQRTPSSSAVEALQKSSAAAATTKRAGKTGDIVICMGSSRPPPGWEDTKSGESSSQKTSEEDPSKDPDPAAPKGPEKDSKFKTTEKGIKPKTLDQESKAAAPKAPERDAKPKTFKKQWKPASARVSKQESKSDTVEKESKAVSSSKLDSESAAKKKDAQPVVASDKGKTELKVTSDDSNVKKDSSAAPLSGSDAPQSVVTMVPEQTDISKPEKDAARCIVTECKEDAVSAFDATPAETEAQPA
ncbi:hypothetical protein CP532_1130 [Ophiocordyceps camponoti-leonardi (nom. inval.)]|nr:hypothetical protein CP532_1130 [Ophiocordyceps camponoti-leonardi (nom. inval.)]